MAEKSYDCVVIGSGPGGYAAPIRSAQVGMRTAIVEKDRIGGRCLNVACIPAKAVLRAADVMTEAQHGADLGIQVEGVSVDFAGVAAHRDKVVKTLTGGVSGLMKKNKVDVIEGHAALTADANVRIGAAKDGTEIEARNVVLATGSVPKPILGLSFGGRVLGTETAWALQELPGSLAVIGAGAAGTEVASASGRVGTADAAMRASEEGVFATGEIVPGPALAHQSSDEGVIAVEAAAGQETHPIDYRFVPAATFCHPQVAGFGLTEKAARDEGRDVVVGKIPVGAVGAPLVYGDRVGMIKLIGDREYGELIGGHIVCATAADLIQELVNAQVLEGGYGEVARTIHPHPAFAEGVMEAARAADGWLIHG